MHYRPVTARDQRILPRAKRILHAHLPELRERYHIKSLGLFGSYVRGKQKKRSDLTYWWSSSARLRFSPMLKSKTI